MNTKQLRQKILDLAIRGKLVPQDPNDEPASILLERIRAEKERLVKEGLPAGKAGKINPPAGRAGRDKNESFIVLDSDKLHYEQLPDGSRKCIEDEIPFDVPDGWTWVRLGSIAFYKKGPFGSSITKSMFVPDSNNAIKVYEQKNAIYKDETLGNYFISSEKFEELKGFEVFPHDIIVSCAGTIGESFVMPSNIRRGIINQALMRIMLYEPALTEFYLMYFDFVLKGDAKEQGKGTAMKNIPPFDVLKQYLMPLPPQNEQIRILNYLNQLQTFIANIEVNKDEIKAAVSAAKSKILSLAIRGKLVPPAGRAGGDKNNSAIVRGDDNSYYEKLPTGWAWARLDEVLDYEQPTQYLVDSTDYSNDYSTPVLTAGKSFIIGYTNEQEGICFKLPVIIFDDFTTDSRYVDFPFKVKSSAMKILRTKSANIKYLYYFMQTVECNHTTHKRYWISDFSQTMLALPPLPEQARIVIAIENAFAMLDEIAENIK